MNKKTIMSIIAVLVIFVIIIIISLILLNLENGENEKPSNEKEIIQTEQISQVKDNNLFFTIENCLAKYKYILNLNYEEQFDDLNMPTLAYEYGIQTEEQKKQAVINTLDKQYLEENNININNIYDFLDESTEEIEVEAIKINNILDNNSKIKIYTIYAKIKYLEQNKETFEFNIIKVDESQEAFSVYPLKDGEYENLDDIKINNNIEKIDKNNNNVYINMEYSDGQIATKYFQEYKQLMLTNIQEAYEKLNNEYKQKRFGNINKFESFVKDNLEKIEYMQIYQFSVQEQEGYKKYRSLVLKQISAYNPDIIVACFTGIYERLKPIVEDIYLHFSGQKFHYSFPNVCSEGADVAVAMDNDKMLLWAYHPSYTHVTDKGYFETIVKGASFLQSI